MANIPPKLNLKALLKDRIKDTIKANQLEHRGGFLTIDFVRDTLTTENLAEQLLDHSEGQKLSGYDRRELAKTIRNEQKQLYAILLLMDESHRIHRVPLGEIDSIKDTFLFKPTTTETTTKWYALERVENLTFFEGIATTFYKKQWIFPPYLSATETLAFPEQHFVFPFTSYPRLLGGGLHGDVYAVDVSSHSLQTCQGDQISRNTRIAYKKIVKRQPRDWDLVQREVDMLQTRRHDNITPLLGNFFAGHELPSSASSTTRCLYLLSPLADMDMEVWFKHGSEYLSTEEQRRFIYFDAMLGLASGVTYIHREINERVGYHRDIKPSNLLLFRDARGSQVWKICDFGSSNLKSPGDTGTANVVTSPYWAPIEYFTDRNSDDGQTHGRSHDVFSLGCVFLYLATILHRGRGPTGLPLFEELRKKGETNAGALKGVAKEGAFCKSIATVHAWVQTLLEECKSDEDKKILALIDEMLLPRNERVYSWEVEIDLFILADPKRSCGQINKRLRSIIQQSRGYNSEMKHNPFLRAEKKLRAQTDNREPMLRSDEFLNIIYAAGWQDYSPQSTTGNFTRSSMSQKILSNMLSPNKLDTVFGRQDLYRSISNAFQKTDVVALYGLGGVGKSRIAREYASQFMNPTNEILKRHTFEVNATNESTLLDSYVDIAQRINKSQNHPGRSTKGEQEITCNNLKAWLQDRRNGGWFMVVRGFDSVENAADFWGMLPMPESGFCQMIVITRTCATVNNLLGHEACVPVDALGQEDSMRLFNRHIQRPPPSRNPRSNANGVENRSDYQTLSLVDTLWSPLMIKSAAKHMNDDWLTVEHMNNRLDNYGFSAVRTPVGDYLRYILRPLGLSSSSHYKEWPRVVKLLFLLAFFDSQGVGWELLLLEYTKEEEDLIKFLKTLQDCSMIWQDHQENGLVYVVNSHVRRVLLGWMEHSRDPEHVRSQDHGPEALLKRYNKALSMTYRAYKHRYSTPSKRSKTKPLKPHASKQVLMPHFERFLDFTKKYPEELNFSLSDLAVRAVILFSKVLLDKDRYDDAMRVTAYAHAHFKCDLSELDAADDEKSKQARVSFHLVRQLVHVYLARPQDDCSIAYWSKAEELIEKLQLDAPRLEGRDLEWTKFTSPTLEIQLDKVRVYWKSEQIPAARRELSHIMDSTGVLTMRGNQLLEPGQVTESLSHLGIPKTLAEKEQKRNAIRKLQIRVTRENGLLHTAEGILHDRSDPKLARKSWDQARQALVLARRAVSTWFSDDTALFADIGVEIAVANTKIGIPGLVDEAIKILEGTCNTARSSYGQCRRTWDMERRLNEARLKSENHIGVGTESLRELLRLYEARLGPEKVATKKCASLLAKGLELTGKREERYELGQRYPGLGQSLEQESRDGVGLYSMLKLYVVAFVVWLVSGGRYN